MSQQLYCMYYSILQVYMPSGPGPSPRPSPGPSTWVVNLGRRTPDGVAWQTELILYYEGWMIRYRPISMYIHTYIHVARILGDRAAGTGFPVEATAKAFKLNVSGLSGHYGIEAPGLDLLSLIGRRPSLVVCVRSSAVSGSSFDCLLMAPHLACRSLAGRLGCMSPV